MIEGLELLYKDKQAQMVLELGNTATTEQIKEIFSVRPRVEKIAIKDAKLRTFITDDNNRDNLVGHVYDITYGQVRKKDNLIMIDDSIVRGTTLKKYPENIRSSASKKNCNHFLSPSNSLPRLLWYRYGKIGGLYRF